MVTRLLAVVSAAICTVALAVYGPASQASAAAVVAQPVSMPGGMVSLPPSRLLDTRSGQGAVAAGGAVVLPVAGHGGVPAAGVSAVVLNVTVVSPGAGGFVTVWGEGARPGVSSVNFAPRRTVANLVVASVGSAGSVSLYNGSAGTVQLVADVSGYFVGGAPVDAGAFGAVPPSRLLDTRSGQGAVAAGGAVVLPVAGHGGVPASGVSAVVLNVTVTSPTAGGHLTVHADGTGLPVASSLNFDKGTTVANGVFAPVPDNGEIDLYVGGSGTAQVIADIAGYVLGPSADTTPPGAVSDLTVTAATETTATLSWTNPDDTDFAGVTIRRAVGTSPPASPTAGVVVADIPAPAATYTDTGLIPGTQYSYAAFAHDPSPNHAPARTVSPTLPPLTWSAARTIDPFRGGLSAVSCLNSTMCVAVDRNGGAVKYNGSSWSAMSGLTPTGPNYGLDGVSCRSTSFCIAVDDAGHAVRYNGTAWLSPTSILPNGVLTSVSCASTTFCIAVGENINTRVAYAVRFDGSSWSAPTRILGNVAFASSVSCPTTSFCAALGQDGSGASLVTRFNGTSWSAAVKVEPSGYDPFELSCSSSSFCMIVDTFGKYVRFNGSQWSSPTAIDPTGDLELFGVSCLSASFCATVGTKSAGGGYVLRFNGTSWTSPAKVAPSQMTGVSCVSDSLCVGVDHGGDALRFNGNSWARSVVDRARGGLTSLSCATATFCQATDGEGNAVRFTGSGWGSPTSLDAVSGLSSVSCATATFCMAVASSGRAYRYNGTAWSGSTQVSYGLLSVSCPVSSMCMAINDNQAIRFNGSTWAGAVTIDSSQQLIAIDCASASFCIAFDDAGNVLRYNGQGWSRPARLDPSGGSSGISVSCPTASLCLAVDGQGNEMRFNGSSWTSPRPIDPTAASGSTTVSCASPSSCVAVHDGGETWTFNGSNWNSMQIAEASPEQGMVSVSCVTTTFCAAVDATNVVISG